MSIQHLGQLYEKYLDALMDAEGEHRLNRQLLQWQTEACIELEAWIRGHDLITDDVVELLHRARPHLTQTTNPSESSTST